MSQVVNGLPYSYEIGRADANKDSSDEWKVKLKWEAELFQYGCLLFHDVGAGFVRYHSVYVFKMQ